jgi:hypothetical protein
VFGRCLSGSLLKSYHALLVLSVGGEITSAAWWHPNHALAHRHHLPHTQHVEQRRRLTEPPLTPARVKTRDVTRVGAEDEMAVAGGR